MGSGKLFCLFVLFSFIFIIGTIFFSQGVSAQNTCFGSDASFSGACDSSGNPTDYSNPCYTLNCFGGSAGIVCNFKGKVKEDGTQTAGVPFSSTGTGSSGATSWTRTARPTGCGLETSASGSGNPSNVQMYTNNNFPSFCPASTISTNHPDMTPGQTFSYSVNGITSSFTCQDESSIPADACGLSPTKEIIIKESGTSNWSQNQIEISLGESLDLSWWYELPNDANCDQTLLKTCTASGDWSGSKVCIGTQNNITPLSLGLKSYTLTWSSQAYGNFFETIQANVTEPIVVNSPNGGENWQISSAQSISWSAPGFVANVKIELSRNNGSSWSTIFSSTPNDGSESWTVTGPETTSALIRISDVSDSSFLDTSNSAFTISVIPPMPCQISSASWSTTNATVGQTVQLNVQGTNCNGQTVSFVVWEYDTTSSDDNVTTNPSNVAFSGTNATGSWLTELQDDGPLGGDPEYYFIASSGSSQLSSGTSGGQLLSVSPGSGQLPSCSTITICGDYADESSCNIDDCDVAEEGIPSDVDCGDSNVDCSCLWNTAVGQCEAGWDGFNDTSSEIIGRCIYTQQSNDDCTDGFLTFSWTANWVWQPGKGPADDSEGLHLQCVPGQKTVECPAQIPLPFFNVYNFVITILVIMAVYFVLNTRKKHKG